MGWTVVTNRTFGASNPNHNQNQLKCCIYDKGWKNYVTTFLPTHTTYLFITFHMLMNLYMYLKSYLFIHYFRIMHSRWNNRYKMLGVMLLLWLQTSMLERCECFYFIGMFYCWFLDVVCIDKAVNTCSRMVRSSITSVEWHQGATMSRWVVSLIYPSSSLVFLSIGDK